MNQDFITKTKEHEDRFLNGEIKINTLQDFENFYNELYNLVNLCEDEHELGKTETSLNYLKCLHKFIKRIKSIYTPTFLLKNIDTIMYQLRVMWLFHKYHFYRKELAADYQLELNQENEVPFKDVKDIKGDLYRIKASDLKTFKDSCQFQKNLFNEYVQVYTCVFETKKKQIELLEIYQTDAKSLRNEFLEGKIKIENKTQWQIFKEKLYEYIKNNKALHNNIEEVHGMKIKENQDEKFIDFVFASMQKVEEKYAGNINEIEISTIVHLIFVMCKYQFLIEEKDLVIASAKKQEDVSEEKEEVYTSAYMVTAIVKSKAAKWKELDKEQKELKEQYKEAHQFIFGENVEQVYENRAV